MSGKTIRKFMDLMEDTVMESSNSIADFDFKNMTLDQLKRIARNGGYIIDDVTDMRFDKINSDNHAVYVVDYVDQISGESDSGYVFVFIGKNGKLVLDF